METAVQALRDEKIVCGSRNNRIRVSLAHFNDENDVRALIRVLKQVSATPSAHPESPKAP